jgi:hypothetical protein
MRFLLLLKMATGDVTPDLVRWLNSVHSSQPGKELVYLFFKMATGDVTPDLMLRLNSAILSQLSAR